MGLLIKISPFLVYMACSVLVKSSPVGSTKGGILELCKGFEQARTNKVLCLVCKGFDISCFVTSTPAPTTTTPTTTTTSTTPSTTTSSTTTTTTTTTTTPAPE